MHKIRGFIGKKDIICEFKERWSYPKTVNLQQGFSMILLTDDLFYSVTELCESKLSVDYSSFFAYLTPDICELLEQESKSGKLAYVETDYFEGVGSQSAILYEKGKIKIDAIKTETTLSLKNDDYFYEKSDEEAINIVLKEMGVYKEKNKDAFVSIGLNNVRNMK